MNYPGQHKFGKLKVCRMCGMDAGVRKVTVKDPERFFVVCEVCGYKTRPHATQNSATKEWNNERKTDSDW